MAKRPPPGKCIYCLKDFEILTWDHVFPTSWYPNTTPENLEKWKIPCCSECNTRYSKIEEDLRVKLGLCIDPAEMQSNGIADKVLHSINPDFTSDIKEKSIRQRKREKMIKELIKFDNLPNQGLFPNFGPQRNTYYPEYLAVLMSEDNLKDFSHKLVRGLTYKINNLLIEKDYRIGIFFVHDNDAQPFVDLIKRFGCCYDIGPGFRIGYATARDDNNSRIYSIEIWGKLKIYAAVERINDNDETRSDTVCNQ
ncbi:MAG: hypothetical protein QME51_02175 [Planctomycetota bacterium]|nr:hypothetical protein [Planctomycetota bacterium]